MSTECSRCKSYDPRSRWCATFEDRVRHPTATTSCAGYDGPRDEDEEEQESRPAPVPFVGRMPEEF